MRTRLTHQCVLTCHCKLNICSLKSPPISHLTTAVGFTTLTSIAFTWGRNRIYSPVFVPENHICSLTFHVTFNL